MDAAGAVGAVGERTGRGERSDRARARDGSELGERAGRNRAVDGEDHPSGNGERTGNVGLVTLTLTLHARGVDPVAGSRDTGTLRGTVGHGGLLPARPRHPYAGEPVRTAFRGTRRDTAGKGPAGHARRAREAGVAAASVRAVPSAVDGAAR